MRAVGRLGELQFNEIASSVRNRYGSISDRVLHRHIKDLVEAGLLRKSDDVPALYSKAK